MLVERGHSSVSSGLTGSVWDDLRDNKHGMCPVYCLQRCRNVSSVSRHTQCLVAGGLAFGRGSRRRLLMLLNLFPLIRPGERWG